MRIDFGLILGILLEYIYFVFYADTLFDSKMNKYTCRVLTGIGYLIHLVVCMFGNMPLNVLVFAVVNYILLTKCYYLKKINGIFQVFLLTVLSICCEAVAIFAPLFNIIPTDALALTDTQSFMLTIISKTLYLISIMIITWFFAEIRGPWKYL